MNQDQEIKVESADSNDFIKSLNKIIEKLIDQFGINEVCLIRIKNWFDHKWLNYSGNSVVEFPGDGPLTDSALKDAWREKITVPLFNPNRVLSELFFRKELTENKMFEKNLHKTKDSNANIHNRISNYTENGMFVWYSSDTEINQKGSLMIYIVQTKDVKTFYVSFVNRNNWKINQTKNISAKELENILSDKG